VSDDVHIGDGMALPRVLIAGMGKGGCRRCGAAGYFRFAGGERLFLCPCAQGRVMANVERDRASWAAAQTDTETPPEVP